MEPEVKLLRELIALPSVNPAFLPPKDPRAGEQRVGEFLAATTARMGLDIEFQPVLPGRANLLARLLPAGKVTHRILLAPHLDTVGAEMLSDTFFSPRLLKGRLHGRGACDTKGCVAVMLTALRQVIEGARPKHTEIVFAGLVDEEEGQRGSRALAARRFQADLAIVGEPTRLKVVTGHKGDLWLQLETRGRAAHGSRPELGRNAIREMARIVELVEGDYALGLRQRPHHLLGCATVNVGVIAGGIQPNIVPERCTVNVDRRTVPGETDRSVEKELRVLLKKQGFRAWFSQARQVPCLPMETDANLPWVRQLMACAQQPDPLGIEFYCDASVLSHAGIPSVVFGPGDIAQAHTQDEWISISSLQRAVRILVRFLQGLP